MTNSDFIAGILSRIDDGGREGAWRLTPPPPRYAGETDIVLSGKEVSPVVAESLQRHPAVKEARYVGAAHCINMRLRTDALYDAIRHWHAERREVYHSPVRERDDGLFHTLRYAHYRAACLARDARHWDYDLAAARRLAVAIVLFPYGKDEAGLMARVSAFARVHAEWHETVLAQRAAEFRKTNRELMQKEAIQYPVSSALLARAAAITLRCGLHLLNIEPTKEWVG